MEDELDAVGAVAEASSATSEEVSASTEQTSASTQQIAAAAQELADDRAGARDARRALHRRLSRSRSGHPPDERLSRSSGGRPARGRAADGRGGSSSTQHLPHDLRRIPCARFVPARQAARQLAAADRPCDDRLAHRALAPRLGRAVRRRRCTTTPTSRRPPRSQVQQRTTDLALQSTTFSLLVATYGPAKAGARPEFKALDAATTRGSQGALEARPGSSTPRPPSSARWPAGSRPRSCPTTRRWPPRAPPRAPRSRRRWTRSTP